MDGGDFALLQGPGRPRARVDRSRQVTDGVTPLGAAEGARRHCLDVLQSGQTLLHYRIVDKIGQGGMGEVYKAEDLKLGRPVAIKLLPARTGKDEEAKRRFLREA